MRPVVRAIVLVVITAGCFNPSEPLSSDTGVLVEVSLWPIDPVQIEGEPTRTRPAVDAHLVVMDDEGREVADARTGAEGVARIVLRPGSYVVRVVECPGAMSLPKEDAAIAVIAGAFANVALACDTGIR